MNKREANFELLRIVAMCGIVMMHYLMATGVTVGEKPDNPNYCVAWIVEAFCYVSVNIYILLSGYFGGVGKAKFKVSKAGMLWRSVFFWSIAGELFSIASGQSTFSVVRLINAMMPISNGRFWFVTFYFALYLLSPALNWYIRNAENKQFLLTTMMMFLLFSVHKFLTLQDAFGVGSGYSLIWFVFLYLVGGYIGRNRVLFEKARLRNYVIIYVICSLITGIGRIIIARVTMRLVGEPRGMLLFMGISAPINTIGSIALFLTFLRIRVAPRFEKIISWLSGASFGVYLIHMNPNFYAPIFNGIFHCKRFSESNWMIVYGIVVVIFTYILCSFAEHLRRYIFSRFSVAKAADAIDEIASRLEKMICSKMG